MSDIKATLTQDMKTAMREDKKRLAVIRFILSELKRKEIDSQKTLSDTEVLNALEKMAKQRRDAAQQYQQANREDLAEQERYELGIIESYLPEKLSEAEVKKAVEDTLSEIGANDIKDMGKAMGTLKNKLQGKADMALVNKLVRDVLSK